MSKCLGCGIENADHGDLEDCIHDLQAAAERACRERDRLVEREAYFAKVLHVADGGQYRADWDGPLLKLQEQAESLAKALEFLDAQMGCGCCSGDLYDKARDAARAALVAWRAKAEGTGATSKPPITRTEADPSATK